VPNCYGSGACRNSQQPGCEVSEACQIVYDSKTGEESEEGDYAAEDGAEMDAAGAIAADQWQPQTTRRPDYAVMDRNTGEMVQLSLLGAEWDQYKVESLRLSLSGGDEYIKSMFDELVDGELTPGAIVEVVCRGIVKEHAPVYKKAGHEGKTMILLEVVRHMTAKIEAAQNVDGEAKVLSADEPDEEIDPEIVLQEADDLRDAEEAGDEA
jgi:hypothetical protein